MRGFAWRTTAALALGVAVGVGALLSTRPVSLPVSTAPEAAAPAAGTGPSGDALYLGVQIDFDAGHWIVEAVSDGGPADRAGILPGDIVERIDGRVPLGRADLTNATPEALLLVRRRGELLAMPVDRVPMAELWRRIGMDELASGRLIYRRPPITRGGPLGRWSLPRVDGGSLDLAGTESVTFVLAAPFCGASVQRLRQLMADPLVANRLVLLTWAVHRREIGAWRVDEGLDLPILLLGPTSRFGAYLGIYGSETMVPGPQVFSFESGRLVRVERGLEPLPGERHPKS